jgi:D-glycero-alpha-D-manno-heptose-7-phosphate kinase
MGNRVSPIQLAQEACRVEIELLKHPIGKQDQYAAAFGGLNFFSFCSDGDVTIEPQRFPKGAPERFFEHLMMFWTGMMRDANSVLAEQKEKTASNFDQLRTMRDHARKLREMLKTEFQPRELGKLLDDTWRLKRTLASTVSNTRIDTWYERALQAGARGGKLLGAGAGGFLLLIVEPVHRSSVKAALSELIEIPMGYESHGSSLLLPSS